MNITHSYGRYLSNGTLVITTSMFIVGLLINPIVGAILFIFTIISFIPSEVLEIDVENRKYRNALVFFKYRKGEWKELGTIKYLSIITNTESIINGNPAGIGFVLPRANINAKVTNCKLRFYKRAGYYIEIDEFDKLENVIELGKEIAKKLNLELLNATQRPPIFIKL